VRCARAADADEVGARGYGLQARAAARRRRRRPAQAEALPLRSRRALMPRAEWNVGGTCVREGSRVSGWNLGVRVMKAVARAKVLEMRRVDDWEPAREVARRCRKPRVERRGWRFATAVLPDGRSMTLRQDSGWPTRSATAEPG